ncbi:MAG: phage tail sheath C-terminal domain-containing protein [Pseudomonadota bacterium]
MPEYLAPGVYVEEVSSGLRPIEGVSTSNVGFCGGTERGPRGVRLITSNPEFERVYGGLIDPQISYLPFAVRGFFENGGRRAFISRAFTSADDPAESAQGTAGDLQFTASGPGDWGARVRVWVDQNKQTGTTDTRVTFRLTVAYFETEEDLPESQDPPDDNRAVSLRRAQLVEEFSNVSNERNRPDYAPTVLKSGSNLVTGSFQTEPAGAIEPTADEPVALTGGSEQQQTDRNAIEEALDLLGEVDLVNILAVPDQGRDVSLAELLVNQCEQLRDRFAVLQGAQTFTTPDNFRAVLPVSTYCAVYHPWIRVFDPRRNDTVVVPPCGHVAGVYARTDVDRGVHKAPANEQLRGLYLREIGDERTLNQQINRQRHDIFNPANINIIRDFRADGRGIRVFGARTFSADPEWRYISVRRLFLFIEESIEEGTQWVVFEPNDDTTRAAVRRNVSAFLLGVWRSGALAGLTQDEAFFVKCDLETTTQADIDAGRLICLVGVAPVKPAEFVIFRFSQKTAGE